MTLWLAIFEFVSQAHVGALLFALMFVMAMKHMFIPQDRIRMHGRRLFLWFLCISCVQYAGVLAVYWVEWHHEVTCGLACRLFFPPYSNFYFNQIIVNWLATFAFNAAVGLVGGILFAWFARKTRGRFIDQLDVDLLTVGGMVAGWPNILIFYALVFVLTVCITIARAFAERSAGVRMIITPSLPIAGAVIALFGDQLARLFRLYEIGVTQLL